MNKESLVDWASSWVPDVPEGQRKRFAEALASELENWEPPAPDTLPNTSEFTDRT